MVLYRIISHCIHFLHLIGTIFFQFLKTDYLSRKNFPLDQIDLCLSQQQLYCYLLQWFSLDYLPFFVFKNSLQTIIFLNFCDSYQLQLAASTPPLPALHINTNNKVWIRNQLDVTFVLSFISHLQVAQHVLGNHVPIFRSWWLRSVITTCWYCAVVAGRLSEPVSR